MNTKHAVAFLAAYLLAAMLGQWLQTAYGGLPIGRAQSGLLLAALLVSERRAWLPYAAAAWAAEVAIQAGLYHMPFLTSAALGLGPTIEALVAGLVLHRWCGVTFLLQSRREALGLLLATVPAALAGAATSSAALAVLPAGTFGAIWPHGWLSGIVGILTVTPLLLALFHGGKTPCRLNALRYAHAATLLIALIICGRFIFDGYALLAFVIMPLLLWTGMCFGLPCAAAAGVALAVIAIRYAAGGYGGFAAPAVDDATRALLAQACLVFTGAVAAALVAHAHRRQASTPAASREHQAPELLPAGHTAALQRSESRFSALLENELCVIVALSPELQIVEWNRAAEHIFGWPREDALGKDYVTTFVPLERRADIAARMRKVWAGDPAPVFECGIVHRNGSRRMLQWHIGLYADGQQQPLGLLAVGQEITGRIQAEAGLRDTHDSLQLLSARQDALLEAERARIAREIHDELGAAITGVTMHVQMALTAGADNVPPVRERLQQALQLVDAANQSMHRIISDLRPSVLDHLGIWGGLEWLANQWQSRTGLPCELILDPALTERMVDGERATALFRIVQEALTNVTRHARATRVDILTQLDGDAVCVSIQDDGKGITAERSPGADSMGLLNMRERARRFGGTLQITGAPGRGTRVALRMPLGN